MKEKADKISAGRYRSTVDIDMETKEVLEKNADKNYRSLTKEVEIACDERAERLKKIESKA